MLIQKFLLPFAIDIFVEGLCPAAFLIAVIADFTFSKKFASVQLTGAVIAPLFAIISVLFLVFDLSGSLRFWEMVLKHGEVQRTGPTIPWVTLILTLFIIITFVYMIISIIAKRFSWGGIARKIVGVIGLPFAIFETIFNTSLFSTFSTNPCGKYLLPLFYIILVMVTSVAVIAIILAILKIIRIMIFKKA